MRLTKSEMMRAFFAGDATYDGLFWAAVKTTRIFCRPTCTARKPKPENVELFSTPSLAQAAGYRACKRCRPLDEAAAPAWAASLLALVESAPARITTQDLRARSITPDRARRYFRRTYGVTFSAYARAQRLARSLDELNHGNTIDDAADDGGYASVSGFRDAFGKQFGRPPGRGRAQLCLVSKRLPTPFGAMFAAASADGICMLEFTEPERLHRQIAGMRRRLDAAIAPGSNAHLEQLERELAEYFTASRRGFTVPLVLSGTPFQERVWQALREIPYGATASYSDIARRIGQPGAVRAVGTANGMNRMSIVIPCHRVIRDSGELGGYGGGLRRKQWLLDLETRVAGALHAGRGAVP